MSYTIIEDADKTCPLAVVTTATIVRTNTMKLPFAPSNLCVATTKIVPEEKRKFFDPSEMLINHNCSPQI